MSNFKTDQEAVPPHFVEQASKLIGGHRHVGRQALALAGVSLAVLVSDNNTAYAESGKTSAPTSALSYHRSNDSLRYRPDFDVSITAADETQFDPAKRDQYPDFFNTLKAVGVTATRLVLNNRSNPIESAFWLDLVQKQSEYAASQGLEVSVVLMQSPDDKPDYSGYPEWAAQSVAQLPHVDRFIILNEPTLKLFWRKSIRSYINTLHSSYSAIKAVRPNVEVSGLAMVKPGKSMLKESVKYAKKYGGLGEIMDSLSLHLYGMSATADQAEVKRIEELWKGPIHIDEGGWPVSGEATHKNQARNLIRFLNFSSQDKQIKTFTNYRLTNQEGQLPTGLRTSGEDSKGLPSFFALKRWLQKWEQKAS